MKSPVINRAPRVSPSSLASSRLGVYHMSRQHPAVLDHLYIKDRSIYGDPNIYKSSPVTSPDANLALSKENSFSRSGGRRHSLVMASLVKHALNNNRQNTLAGGASIVQLVAKSGRRNNMSTSLRHSPVFIKLSTPPTEPKTHSK